MQAPVPPQADPQRFVQTVVRVLAGALAVAALAALVLGVIAWFWAVNADNAETNSEAAGWFVVGAFGGALFGAPVGAVVGFARSGRKISLRHWVLPVIGFLCGCLAAVGLLNGSPWLGVLAPAIGLGLGFVPYLIIQAAAQEPSEATR